MAEAKRVTRWLVKVRTHDGERTGSANKRAHPKAIDRCKELTLALGPGGYGEVIDTHTGGVVYAVRVTLDNDGQPKLTEEKL